MKIRSNIQFNIVSAESNAFVSGGFAVPACCCMCCIDTDGLQRCFISS